MVLLENFIKQVIKDIQSGIESFNKNNPYKAEMPSTINFQVYVLYQDGKCYILEPSDQNMNNLTKTDLTISVLHYPWLKKD